MSQELINTLSWFAYYAALGVWVVLTLLLIIGLIAKRWDTVKRAFKYLINSIVFLLAYVFYLDMALYVRPPVATPQLKAWVNAHVANYLYISVVAIIILTSINFLFYKKVERQRHKADLFILTALDIAVLLCGAWFSGHDAYYGLLQEMNR